MKKIALFFVLALAMVSCSESEGTPSYFLSTVEDVEMPETYKIDSVSEIKVLYKRPSDCHVFDGFFYRSEDNIRTVAIQFVKPDNGWDCLPDDRVFEMPLRFKPQASGTYLFRFWKGKNEAQEDVYIEHEIVVP